MLSKLGEYLSLHYLCFFRILFMRSYLFIFIACLLVYSCVPPNKEDGSIVKIDYTNESHRSIVNLKDRREVDSLIFLFDSEDVTERYLSVQAFASIKSSLAIKGLAEILSEDPSEEVRLQAAYALGQIGDPSITPILTMAFGNQDTSDYDTELRGTILEAVGKVGDINSLQLISGISTYTPEQNQLLKGQLRAFYRFAQRGLRDNKADETVMSILSNNRMSVEVRRIAGDFVSRYLTTLSEAHLQSLTSILENESDSEIRVTVANALAKSASPVILPTLLELAVNDTDYRVRTNILRSIAAYEYAACRDILFRLVKDDNEQIASLAVDAIKSAGHRRDAWNLVNMSKEITNPVLKSKILGATINDVPYGYVNTRSLINKEITTGFGQARTQYERASFVEALALDPINWELFKTQGLNSKELVVQTRAIMAIPKLMTNLRTRGAYRTQGSLRNFRNLILTELKGFISQGDAGSVAAAASVLRNPNLGFKEDIDLISPFGQAMERFRRPETVETKYELQDLLGYLQDTTVIKEIPDYNHSIDWSALENISDSSHAYIITPKGQIKIQFMTSHAPASVANFVSLSQSNYYNGKYFHRVVPNFVIQGGCSRGDGYGGLDYTIRSELGPKYYDGQGYIGMASAGLDTEGTQWFITHSATPHLDGRYTIFGRVTEGMDVVHNIHVGDVIQDVRILKY
jgi:cyclophilin family peptidyl-prolyl cis-trans isomerase/HEAT repeat protein